VWRPTCVCSPSTDGRRSGGITPLSPVNATRTPVYRQREPPLRTRLTGAKPDTGALETRREAHSTPGRPPGFASCRLLETGKCRSFRGRAACRSDLRLEAPPGAASRRTDGPESRPPALRDGCSRRVRAQGPPARGRAVAVRLRRCRTATGRRATPRPPSGTPAAQWLRSLPRHALSDV
jgi:hypothetical protein